MNLIIDTFKQNVCIRYSIKHKIYYDVLSILTLLSSLERFLIISIDL